MGSPVLSFKEDELRGTSHCRPRGPRGRASLHRCEAAVTREVVVERRRQRRVSKRLVGRWTGSQLGLFGSLSPAPLTPDPGPLGFLQGRRSFPHCPRCAPAPAALSPGAFGAHPRAPSAAGAREESGEGLCGGAAGIGARDLGRWERGESRGAAGSRVPEGLAASTQPECERRGLPNSWRPPWHACPKKGALGPDSPPPACAWARAAALGKEGRAGGVRVGGW